MFEILKKYTQSHSVCRLRLGSVYGMGWRGASSTLNRQIIRLCSFALHVVARWDMGLSDARFIFNGSLRFSRLSDAGRGAVTLGCAEVLEDTALGPLPVIDAIDLFD